MASRIYVDDCLRAAAKRDAKKGGSGLRSTREVADFCDISLSKARRELWDLAERGLVEACDEGASGASGNPIYWRLITKD